MMHEHSEPDEGGDAEILRFPHSAPDDDGPQTAELVPVEDEPPAEVEPARPRWAFNTRFLPARREPGDPARRGARVASVALSAARVTRERSAPVGRGVVRHSGYALGGTRLALSRSWSRATHSELTEAIRLARASGDTDKVQALEEQKRRTANDRFERGFRAVKMAAGALAGVVGLWLLVSLCVLVTALFNDFEAVWTDGYWAAHVTVAGWVGYVWSWRGWLLALGVLVAVGAAWSLGRAHGLGVPGFAQDAQHMPTQSVPIDETTLAQALGGLGIKAINEHLKQGLPLQYTTMPHRVKTEDGSLDVGVSAQVRLPGGTSTEEIVKRSKLLAANLARASVEVWPSVGADEGLLSLWIADRGSLDGTAPAWPWLEKTEAIDLYQGVPVGRTLDGRTIIAPVDGASYLVGGQPGQGKSMFVRSLVAGALFDPRARIRVYALASNNDYVAMKPRLERYVTGLGQETIASVLAEMVELYAELERRGQYMETHGHDTASDAGFEPIVAVFDEIHQAFQCRDKKLREEIAAYAEDLAKLARKYGILVIYSTQSADAQSIPKGVTRQSQQRIAYSIVDQPANDGLLGSGAYKAGITATSLRAGNKTYHGDRGKSVTVGLVPDADWAMCVGFLIDSDVLPAIVERAMSVQSQAGLETTQAALDPERDLLVDVLNVLNGEDKRLATVARLLGELHASYRGLSGTSLEERLGEYGPLVGAAKGSRYVRAARVAEQVGSGDDEA